MTDETQQNTQNSTGQNPPETKPKRKRATQEEMLERKKRELDKLKNNTQKLGKEIEQLEKKVNEHNRKKENNIKYMAAGYFQKRYEEMHDGQKMFDLTYYRDVKRTEERTEEWLQELQNGTKSDVSNTNEVENLRRQIATLKQENEELQKVNGKERMYIDVCRLIEKNTNVRINRKTTQHDLYEVARQMLEKTTHRNDREPLLNLQERGDLE